jgi:hypothetical protein
MDNFVDRDGLLNVALTVLSSGVRSSFHFSMPWRESLLLSLSGKYSFSPEPSFLELFHGSKSTR